MTYTYKDKNISLNDIIRDLDKLRNFTGAPSEFWPEYIGECTRLSEAEFGVLIVREKGDTQWKTLCFWPKGSRTAITNDIDLASKIEGIAEAAIEDDFAWEEIKSGKKGTVIGIRLNAEDNTHDSVAVFYKNKKSNLSPEEAITRLKLVSGIPAVYQLQKENIKAKTDVILLAEALDIMTLLNNEEKYLAAAMTLCNEIAARFNSSRVSLGWLKNGYIRIQAVSHMEQFEKKMSAVQSLETAMEESFDQDEEIVFPVHPGALYVSRQHEQFAKEHGVENILSVPVRLNDLPEGILTCEREGAPFTEMEINGIRLFCDQASRRLGDLKRRDKWIGARGADYTKEKLSVLLGVEHTIGKCIGILVTILLCILLFGRMEYKVEASFILKTDDVAYLPSPFDGYIQNVHIQPGDDVKENQLLLTLDTQELILEESSAIADRTRYSRESEKYRAKNALAEMKISQALKTQVQARLELIRYHLLNAEIRAAFSGIIVEGDLKEMLGAPVRKGDVLFKIARIEKMYAELDLNEKDVHEINNDSIGKIAFVSMPENKYPISVDVIEPVAIAAEEGNIFKIRCTFPENAETWWRPGMSGVAKVNVGKRNILWIISHRTIDFLRLLLWW